MLSCFYPRSWRDAVVENVAGCCKEWVMKLNGDTIEILTKEFPWLPKLLYKYTTDFSVKVLDLDTLSLAPRYARDRIFRIYLISREGRKIGEVGRKTEWIRFGRVARWVRRKLLKAEGEYFSRADHFGENLEGALVRLAPEGSDSMQFVLELDGHHATLHKVPRSLNLQQHLERKRDELRARLVAFVEDK